MPELVIVVRDEDMPTLQALAEQQWRTEQQQACALLEQALRTERARADPNRRSRSGTRRNGSAARSNGAVRVEA